MPAIIDTDPADKGEAAMAGLDLRVAAAGLFAADSLAGDRRVTPIRHK
jgi:hypothetical protein